MLRQPRLFVLSGPSGAGKGTLISLARETNSHLALAVSATTRAPRKGETDGVEYYFLSDEEFDEAIAADEFVEWANVHGKRYGTLKTEIDRLFGEGYSVALDIDVQGALNVRKTFPEVVLIFIEPPSLEELERRLRNRGTEDEESIQLRLANAVGEMELAGEYDVVILNDDLDEAVEELLGVLEKYESESRTE